MDDPKEETIGFISCYRKLRHDYQHITQLIQSTFRGMPIPFRNIYGFVASHAPALHHCWAVCNDCCCCCTSAIL